jgi:hypothetical protein
MVKKVQKVGASMKASRSVCVVVILLAAAADLLGSGPVGIYGIVEKVIFEPDDKSLERIQIWGAFAFVDGGLSRPGATSKPQRGYLYFTLPSGNEQLAAKTEWVDLKTVAGTGQALGFGNWGFVGSFSGLESRTPGSNGLPYFLELFPGGGRQTDVRVRPQSEVPMNPAVYSTNAGIVKLAEQGSHSDIVQQLKEALKTR